MPADPCLHDHDVHRVAQGVVQLPSEPSPLLQHDPLLQGVSLPLLRVVQLAAGARAVPEHPATIVAIEIATKIPTSSGPRSATAYVATVTAIAAIAIQRLGRDAYAKTA